MTTVTRAYVSRLAGLTVFDPNGDRVGKVRDVLVALRVGTAAPRVLGLIVEVVARRRIFCPMGRVTAVDATAVMLASGTVNLKRFEQRAGETLVLGELLDRRVTMTEDGRPAVVVDASMEQNRTGDWVITRLAVAEPGPDGPEGGGGVPFDRHDPVVVLDPLEHAVLPGRLADVAEDIGAVGDRLVTRERLEVVAQRVHVGVAADAGIAEQIPGAAQIGTGLEQRQ